MYGTINKDRATVPQVLSAGVGNIRMVMILKVERLTHDNVAIR